MSAETLGQAYAPSAQMSQQMRSAIDLFDRGEDTDAMDRFLDVLVHGDPAERSLANEYLNLITQRLSVNGTFRMARLPVVSEPIPRYTGPIAAPPLNLQVQPLAQKEAAPAVQKEAAQPAQKETAQPAPTSPTPSAQARSDIERKIQDKKKAYLNAIKDMEGLRLIMAGNNPEAIGIPVALLFEKGVLFRRDAARFLQPLTGLAYALGAAQIVLLPEGFAIGDSKIIDMRRTMAVTSQLLSAGVAPARIRVNLLQSQVDLPKAIADFQGIIALFVYDQPLPLKTEHVLVEESGPPISLGVFPDGFQPGQEQGALIEFSVVEPPSGLKSWRFRILPPGYRTSVFELAPIQQIVGSGAVFHQVYWNGRRGYWGRVLPEGRYEAVLSATDAKGRTNTLHRWIDVRGEKPHLEARPKPKPKVAHLKKKAAKAAPHKHGKAKPAAAAQKPRPAAQPAGPTLTPQPSGENKPLIPPATETGPATPAKAAPPAQAPPQAGRASDGKGAFSYRISFVPNTQTMTQEGEQHLAQAADAMGVYLLANLNVVGHAGTGETNPEALANSRAQAVSSVLTRKYSVDPRRITLQAKVGDGSQPEVEIFIVAGKE